MMRILLMFLLASCVLADQPPQSVVDGHYPGRSGDIVVHLPSSGESAVDGSLYFLHAPAASSSMVNDFVAKHRSISSDRVGDVLSHLMGTAPLNPEDSRADFPLGSLFEKPNANLLVVVDGPDGEAFAAGAASLPSMGSVDLVDRSYPRGDSVASLSTVLSSSVPSVHGIVRSAWFDKAKGEPALAYDAWCPGRTGPTVANVFDVATRAFQGQSLFISGSASSQLSKAMCSKAYVLEDSSANYAYQWDSDAEDGGAFRTVYPGGRRASSSGTPAFRSLSRDDVFRMVVSDDISSSSTTRNAGVSVRAPRSGDDASERLEVTLEDGRVVDFDLSNADEFALFSEIAFMKSAMEQVSSDEFHELVHDDSPDFFSFGFSSVRAIAAANGNDSAKVAAALALIRNQVVSAQAVLSLAYGEDFLSEALFLGGGLFVDTTALEQAIVRALGDDLATTPDNLRTYFPDVYIKDEANLEAACEAVRAAVAASASAHPGAQAYCAPQLEERSSTRRAERGVDRFVGYMQREASSDDDGTDVFIFQCVIWFNAILVAALLMAIYPITSIQSSLPQIVPRGGAHDKNN